MKRFGLIVLVAVLFSGAALRDAADRWIDKTILPVVLTETSVEVRDRNGDLLRAFQAGNGIWRLDTRLGAVDRGFVDMLIRYEDKRFWTHSGVDPLALFRAVAQALRNGRTVSGGSTLTMQVARLLEDGTTGRWAGKLRQIRVAMALERRLTKRQILSLYLTNAPYGGNLEGVRSASLAWFGKEPKRLSPSQSAFLVSMPQSPETRRPDRHPEAGRIARDRVISRMQNAGLLSDEEARGARSDQMPAARISFPRSAAHLSDELRDNSPGLPVHRVTLERRLQIAMEHLARDAVRTRLDGVSAAIVVADHQSGDVLALVGSAGYDDSGRNGFVDMTGAIRSPGSTLKPLIYGLAFDQGLVHPETIIHDGPVAFGQYRPVNFDGRFRGDIRVREALQQSLNIPVIRLADELGPARIMAALRKSGATPKLPGGAPGLAIALGGVGVSLRDLVQLYAALARDGQGPLLRTRLTEPVQTSPRILSPVATWQVGDILAGVVPPRGAPAGVVAYKTGTSYGNRDAWSIGFDGRHVVGVWMGRADGTPVPGAFGGDLAAPLMFEVFGRIKPVFEPLAPPPADTLIVGAARLPKPLQRFTSRKNAFQGATDPVRVAFPPNGSVLETDGGPLTLKLQGGEAPFLVLSDGRPVAKGLFRREFEIPPPGDGFTTLVVVDGAGRSDRVTIRVD